MKLLRLGTTWLIATALALILGTVIAWKPLTESVTWNARPPSFKYGPVPGMVSQTVKFPGGSLDSISIWAQALSPQPTKLELHIFSSPDRQPFRSTLINVLPRNQLTQIRVPIAPIYLPSNSQLRIELALPMHTQAELFLGATRDDAFLDGMLIDAQLHSPPGVDLAFILSGTQGPVTRFLMMLTQATLLTGIGLIASALVGTVMGLTCYGLLDSGRGRLSICVAVGIGVTLAAALVGLLATPVQFTYPQPSVAPPTSG